MKNTSKAFSFLLIFFLFSQLANGQKWEKTLFGGHGESLTDVEMTMDGGFILSGSHHNYTFDSVTVHVHTPKTYIIRTDAEGDIIWEHYELNDSTERLDILDILVFSDNSIIVLTRYYNISVGTYKKDHSFRKYDPFGNLVWEKFMEVDVDAISDFIDLNKTSDGGFLSVFNASTGNVDMIQKRDSLGNKLWEKQIEINDYYYHIYDALMEPNDELLLVCNLHFTIDSLNSTEKPWDILLIQLDESGEIIWNNYIEIPGNQIPISIDKTHDNGYCIVGQDHQGYPSNIPDAIVVKLDSMKNLLWHRTIGGNKTERFSSALPLKNGDIITVGTTNSFGNDTNDGYLLQLDKNGEFQYVEKYGLPKFHEGFSKIFESPSGNFNILGRRGVQQSYTDSVDIFLLVTDSFGITFNNYIEGNVFDDLDTNCIYNLSDSGLVNRMVIANSSDYFEITQTDSNGYYNFTLDTGIYEINAVHPYFYWEFCNNPQNINFPQTNDTLELNIAAFKEAECPYLETSISTSFLRRCSTGVYYVNYCNYGTISADTPFIEITLDTFLNFLSSSIPLANQNGNVLTFDLDTIGIGECGNFTIEVEVDCDAELGQSHCVEAHIYPDSICSETMGWTGASIELNGTCAGDSIHFSIKNAGNSPSSGGLGFIVIEDDVILKDGAINVLSIGEVQEVTVANIGATYRIEADQEPNHPGNSMPTYIIEGCGQGFTPGFVNQFPMDDAAPYIDIDCRENVGSYDPNDKQAFPTGFDDEHFIEQNTDIEYLIRFQNTGTDTAFRVIIRDTLSNFLDVATVRPSASSHSYQFDISGPGILKFTFDNILLPDSTTNEPASHGFVKYRISQKENVPLGSVINNSAAIYFDFNEPIITNTTYHTVGEDFVPIYVSVNTLGKPVISANVFPNPFSKKATVELSGIKLIGEKTFSLFNSTGQLMQEFIFENNRFEINGEKLNNGVYYFKINNEEGMIATGKVVVLE